MAVSPGPEFLKTQSGRTGLKIVLTVGTSLLAKALGFVRVQQIAATLGVSYHADVLLISVQLIWLVETVLISSAAVPIVLSRIYRTGREEGSDAAAHLFLHTALWCATIAGLFGLVLWLSADAIFAALLPGLETEARELFRVLAVVSIATPLALACAHFLSLINRLTDNGVWYSVPQVVINIVALGGLILGYRMGGSFEAAVGMMVGMAIGTLAVCVLQLLVMPTEAKDALKLSLRRHRQKVLRLPNGRAYWSRIGVLLLAALVQEAYIYADFYFASSVGEGSVGLVGYSSRLSTLVNMLLVASAFVILEPRWARALVNHSDTAWQHIITPDTLVLLCLLAAPVSILFFYSNEVTRLIYSTDQFAAPDRDLIVQLTQIYGLSIIGLSYTLITTRLLILMDQERIIVLVNLLALLVKLVLAAWLVDIYGLPGLAISTFAVLLLQGSCNSVILISRGVTLRILSVIKLLVSFTIVFLTAAWLVPVATSEFWGLLTAISALCAMSAALAVALRYVSVRANRS